MIWSFILGTASFALAHCIQSNHVVRCLMQLFLFFISWSCDPPLWNTFEPRLLYTSSQLLIANGMLIANGALCRLQATTASVYPTRLLLMKMLHA